MNNPYRTALIAILLLAVVFVGAFILFVPPMTVCVTWDGIGGPCFDWHGGAPNVLPVESIDPMEL